jgi:hypothetical protein
VKDAVRVRGGLHRKLHGSRKVTSG